MSYVPSPVFSKTIDVISMSEYDILLEMVRYEKVNEGIGENEFSWYVYWNGTLARGQTSRIYRCWNSEHEARCVFELIKMEIESVLSAPFLKLPLFVNNPDIVGIIARKRLEIGV